MLCVATPPTPKSGNLPMDDIPSLEHFVEVLNSAAGVDADSLMDEIGLYEKAGVVSNVLSDVLQRASCIASAERLLAKFR